MAIPSLKHWFENGAWVALAPTVLTGVLGVIALPSGLSTRNFWMLVLFAIVASLWVWWNAARQAKRTDEDRQTLNNLLAHISAQVEPPTQGATEDIRQLRSDQLRARVSKVAEQMRQMEQAFHAARDRLIYDRKSKTNWDTYTSQLIAQSNEQTHRWRTEGQPLAVSLWREMQRRIYGAPPYPQDRGELVALEHGMLAGAAPLSEAALKLEELARQLP